MATTHRSMWHRAAAAMAATLVFASLSGGVAHAEEPVEPDIPSTAHLADEPAVEPESIAASRPKPAESCAKSENGYETCIDQRPTTAQEWAMRPPPESAQAYRPVHPRCATQSPGSIIGITRTEACFLRTLVSRTWRYLPTGARILTGELHLVAIGLAYMSTRSSLWHYQLEMYATHGWGDAVGSIVNGAIVRSGACTLQSASFPPQVINLSGPLAIGESTLVTNVGEDAFGYCSASWRLVLLAPGGYPPSNARDLQMTDIRCDDVFHNMPRGCVVPWFSSHILYNVHDMPQLTRHVARAQASGLPGATHATALIRTTNPLIDLLNRRLACGDAPSIGGYSCDEYPVASSLQGLAAGGSRRTQINCQMPGIPAGSGSTGVSVCMVPAVENSIQGHQQGEFYRTQRIMDGDPFRVLTYLG